MCDIGLCARIQNLESAVAVLEERIEALEEPQEDDEPKTHPSLPSLKAFERGDNETIE